PMGPGNTEKQLQMMMDMESTVLCSTSSYALLLAEEIGKRGIKDKIRLKKGVIGSERWSQKMRDRISGELGIELYDIYGLTEIYGPGIGISCKENCGMHYWDDYISGSSTVTGENLPDGEIGVSHHTWSRKALRGFAIVPMTCPVLSPALRLRRKFHALILSWAEPT
ncbi:MAG: phenylacetate--CoA ligase family protein, partial [Ruminococcus sp.]